MWILKYPLTNGAGHWSNIRSCMTRRRHRARIADIFGTPTNRGLACRHSQKKQHLQKGQQVLVGRFVHSHQVDLCDVDYGRDEYWLEIPNINLQ